MEKEKLMNPSNITKQDQDGFNARFRIQKCVFVAQCLGLNTGYGFNRYKHGPYSPALTKDYYMYARDELKYTDTTPVFDRDACLDIMKHDNNWIEIATTLLRESNYHSDENSLVEYVECIKFPYPKKYIQSVLDDLQKTKLGESLNRLVC